MLSFFSIAGRGAPDASGLPGRGWTHGAYALPWIRIPGPSSPPPRGDRMRSQFSAKGSLFAALSWPPPQPPHPGPPGPLLPARPPGPSPGVMELAVKLLAAVGEGIEEFYTKPEDPKAVATSDFSTCGCESLLLCHSLRWSPVLHSPATPPTLLLLIVAVVQCAVKYGVQCKCDVYDSLFGEEIPRCSTSAWPVKLPQTPLCWLCLFFSRRLRGNTTKKLISAVEDSVAKLCADAPSVDLAEAAAEGAEPADPTMAPLAHFVTQPSLPLAGLLLPPPPPLTLQLAPLTLVTCVP